MSLRPYYLLREFTCTIFVAVHISPSAVANAACDVINSVIQPDYKHNTQKPSLPFLVTLTILLSLPRFKLFSNLSTILSGTIKHRIYLLYADVRNAYILMDPPPPHTPGISDYNLVLLTSTSTSIVHQQPVTKWIVMRRSQEAKETLHACFDRTQTGMYSMTDRITQYSNSDGDRELLRTVQRELKVRLRERARRYMGKSWRTSSSKTT